MDLRNWSWANKKVLVTGHTGFKGVWLTLMLQELGATVVGISLPVTPQNKLYLDSKLSERMQSEYFTDLSTENDLDKIFENHQFDYVFHLAAQSLVIESYENPLKTINSNVLGTSKVLITALEFSSILGILVVTTDKVYENNNSGNRFVESDKLGGQDPYSASKAACELITSALAGSNNPFDIPVATVRAGNVVGGGDFAPNRLIPDIYKSIIGNLPLTLRSVSSTRPWQHILDCVFGYLLVAESQVQGSSEISESFNFGPDVSLSVQEVVKIFIDEFKIDITVLQTSPELYESKLLNLDSTKAKIRLNWKTAYSPQETIRDAAAWYHSYSKGQSPLVLCQDRITNYLASFR